jgi:hypothetical protein
MSFDLTSIKDGLAPILSIFGGLVLGIVCELVVLLKLQRFAARRTWESDAIVTDAPRGMPMLWLLVAATRCSTQVLNKRGPDVRAPVHGL